MLQMLRAMNRWELAEACRAAGLPEGSRPEEIVRAISGAWWAALWGAVEEERILLLRAAESLNLMPRLRRFRHRLGIVERSVYGALIQQAFFTAPEERQTALLSAAEAHLQSGPPPLASPPRVDLTPELRRQLALQQWVSTGAGLRAVTAALYDVPVEPEFPGSRREALFATLASAGPEAWGGRVIEWVRARRGPDLPALFQILRCCWRQRQRLLLEHRVTLTGLQEEEQRLRGRLDALAAERSAARRRRPWHIRPSTGAGIAMGALAGAAAELICTGTVHMAAPLAASSGGLWTLTALAATARNGANPERRALLEALHHNRRRQSSLTRQIAQLEE